MAKNNKQRNATMKAKRREAKAKRRAARARAAQQNSRERAQSVARGIQQGYKAKSTPAGRAGASLGKAINTVISAAVERRKAQQLGYRNAAEKNKAQMVARQERRNRSAYNTLSRMQTLAAKARTEIAINDETKQDKSKIKRGLNPSRNIDAMKAMMHAMAEEGATDTAEYRKARREGRANEYFAEWAMERYGGEDFGEAFDIFKKKNKDFLDIIYDIKNNIDPETGESDPSLEEMSDEERYELIIREYYRIK